MDSFTVLLLGSGGREHALAWKISQSKRLQKLFIAPGNAGTQTLGTNVNLSPADFQAIREFVVANGVHMVVVGPEDPLVKGIRNYFLSDASLAGIPVIGPSKEGAMLEGSKEFAKQFMLRHGIPTAAFRSVTAETLDEGIHFMETIPPPYVLKADGLAAGKGVVIHEHLEHARRELNEMLKESKFGDAGKKVVIEQYLKGIELSVFVITDGRSFRILPNAKDYKRIGEGDTGPNTGGMGAVSPVPFAGAEFMHKVENMIIRPTIKGIVVEELPYSGFIFFGLMNVDGNPYVIEYNCRLGDPEAEVVLPRIKNDLLDLFEAVAEQKLSAVRLDTDLRSTAAVMAVSKGYPGDYEKGKIIIGLDGIEGSMVFHAGTREANGTVLSNGGRVAAVTSMGENIRVALAHSYENIARINFEGMYYRRDIGADLLKYLPEQPQGLPIEARTG